MKNKKDSGMIAGLAVLLFIVLPTMTIEDAIITIPLIGAIGVNAYLLLLAALALTYYLMKINK